jgi:hypothetical protein
MTSLGRLRRVILDSLMTLVSVGFSKWLHGPFAKVITGKEITARGCLGITGPDATANDIPSRRNSSPPTLPVIIR